MLKELEKFGYAVSHYRVSSLMRKLGLEAKTPRRNKVATDSNHKHPVVPQPA